jgi:hypothetical protein
MSNRPNGQGSIEPKLLSDSEKLDVIIDALSELSARTEVFGERLEELTEKVLNMSLPGNSFGIFDEEEN